MKQTGSSLFSGVFPHIRRLVNTDKERRLQFIKTRYIKPVCNCGALAHYQMPMTQGFWHRRDRAFWCRQCLPTELRKRLSMEWQMSRVVVPLAAHMDRG